MTPREIDGIDDCERRETRCGYCGAVVTRGCFADRGELPAHLRKCAKAPERWRATRSPQASKFEASSGNHSATRRSPGGWSA